MPGLSSVLAGAVDTILPVMCRDLKFSLNLIYNMVYELIT